MRSENVQNQYWHGQLRQKAKAFVESPRVQNIIIAAIILNSIQLGLDTFPFFAKFSNFSWDLDFFFVCIFSAELLIKIFAYRWSFFKDFWNIFDLVVVAASLVACFFHDGDSSLSVFRLLRAFRIIRTSRLASKIRSVRVLIDAMFHALPTISALALMLGILYYIFAVLLTKLGFCPDIFSSVRKLFELMTMEGWQDTIKNVQEAVSPEMRLLVPWILIPFMLISAYIFLNLVVGIIVDAMQNCAEQAKTEDRAENDRLALILQQLKEMQKQLNELSAQLERSREKSVTVEKNK